MSQHYPFSLEPLPYAYDALAPNIDARTLEFHHDKHLKTYTDNLNKTLEPYPALHTYSLEKLLLSVPVLPDSIRTAVRNNAGGVYNHQLYFASMRSPRENNAPTGALLQALENSFGSLDAFWQAFRKAALGVFGSGYAWLVAECGNSHKLRIDATPNQNTPLEADVCPLLLVDVWEHAYYLQQQNRRDTYVDLFRPLIDWDVVAQRFDACCQAE